MTFRKRIIIGLIPLLVLLLVLGGVGTILIYRLGHRVGDILRENYDSVVYMGQLNEATQRMDGAFLLAIAGRTAEASSQYRTAWDTYQTNLVGEQNDITVPGERELVEQLTALSERLSSAGQRILCCPGQPARESLLRSAEFARAARDVTRDQADGRPHHSNQSGLDGTRQS